MRPGGEPSAGTGAGEVDNGNRYPLRGETGSRELADDVGGDPGKKGVELARPLDRGRGSGASRGREKEREEEEGGGPVQGRAPRGCIETTAAVDSSPARSRRRRRKIRKATVPTAIQGVAIMRRIE